MFGATLSPLTENLIVLSTLAVTALIIIVILRFALLKSVDAAAEADEQSGESIEKRKKKISAVMKILTFTVLAATLILILIFSFFINTGNQNTVAEAVRIPTAPLPKNFKPPTKKEITESNDEAATRKTEEVEKKAAAENDKAMEKGIELFRKAK